MTRTSPLGSWWAPQPTTLLRCVRTYVHPQTHSLTYVGNNSPLVARVGKWYRGIFLQAPFRIWYLIILRYADRWLMETRWSWADLVHSFPRRMRNSGNSDHAILEWQKKEGGWLLISLILGEKFKRPNVNSPFQIWDTPSEAFVKSVCSWVEETTSTSWAIKD